ncbi:MAG: hypothetical protein HY717_15200 [Planctomycetes bacterium]|nr:hypothetical protein [Planctomycetota bacterium]
MISRTLAPLPSLVLAFTGLLAGLASLSRAADIKETLGAAIPADVQVYSRSKVSPAQASINEQVAAAFSKFARSGVLWDLVDLATTKMPPEGRDHVRQTVEKVLGALKKVSWGELVQKEVAFGVRLKLPIPEYLILFRIAEADGERHREGFRGLFKEIAELVGQPLVASESSEGDAKVASLGLQNAPFAIDASVRGDVLALSLSRELLFTSFNLMGGKQAVGAAGPIIDSPKYQEGFGGLGKGADNEVYVDITGYIGFYKGLLGLAGMQAGSDPKAQAIIGLLNLLLDELGRFGSFTQVGWIEGNRLIGEGRVTLQKGFETSLFYPVFGQQSPLKEPERLVPAEATAFYFSNGLNWTAFYDLAVSIVRDRVPQGADLLMRWDRLQERIRFHPREDLLSWLEGSWGWVAFPGGKGQVERVFFCKLRDPEAARKNLRVGFERVKEFLEQRGQSIELEALEDQQPPGLRVLRVDAFPGCRPVAGIFHDLLVVGSSAEAVGKIGATLRGESPSIAGNSTYQAVVARPEQAGVSEIHYADIQNQLEGLAQLLTGAGFFLSILPKDQQTRPLLKLGAILTKVGVLVRELDLGLKAGGWSQFDREKGQIRVRSATSYRQATARL